MTTRYKVRDGCVLDTVDKGVVYEPLEGISARAMAKALNQLEREGVTAHWDWRHVERRLVAMGVLDTCQAWPADQPIPRDDPAEG